MISASEALRLPCAQLSDEEVAAVDALERELEEAVKNTMELKGLQINVKEANGNVIAEVSQRLKTAGYQVQWTPVVESHPLNKAHQRLVGFQLLLAPSDEAYRDARRLALS